MPNLYFFQIAEYLQHMRWLFIFLLFNATQASSQVVWTIFNKSNSTLPDNTIRAIEADNAGNIWVGTDEGLAKYDGATWLIIDTSNSAIPGNQIRSIAFDHNGYLWVGTLQNGFGIYDGVSWANYSTSNSILPDNQVRSIAFDSTNTAWIGTSGGVVHWADEGWVVYDMFNSPLGANNVNKVFIDENDTKWIGTVNGGISRKIGNTWTTYKNTNSGLTDNTVFDLESDYLGNIWFATPAQGLGRFNGLNWYYRMDANSTIPTNGITCLEVVKNTDVKYMGTFDKGLVRWNNGFVFDSFTVNNSPMPENYINCLKYTGAGQVWIGTVSSGLALFNDTTSFATVSSVQAIVALPISIYPNPSTDKLFISQQCILGNTAVVYDVFGEKVIEQPLTNFETSIDISKLQSGPYILQVVSMSGYKTAKFIKQ